VRFAVRESGRPGKPCRIATHANQLRANLPDHFEAYLHILQDFRYVFTQWVQCSAAVRTRILLRHILMSFAGQMIRQKTAAPVRPLAGSGGLLAPQGGPRFFPPGSDAALRGAAPVVRSDESSFSEERPNFMRRNFAINSFKCSISVTREASRSR